MGKISVQKEALIWGAGKIGRGFLAEIFNDAGYHITFVEYDSKLVDDLRNAKAYTIYKALDSDRYDTVKVHGYDILNSQDIHAISERIICEDTILAVAVHQSALPSVIKTISQSVIKKAKLNPSGKLDIILCVNMPHTAKYCRQLFREYLPSALHTYLDNNIGLIESVVMRICPQATKEILKADKLAVLTNGYPNMPVDKMAFKGFIPNTKMFKLTDNIIAEEMRKIYTLNMSHAMLAYLGTPRGYKDAYEAIQDDEIRYALTMALNESGQGLMREYEFTALETEKWNDDIVHLLENPLLNDTLSRLGADSKRKLGREDRLSGPALLCLKHGITPFYLAQGIAYGFMFDQPNDQGTGIVQSYLRDNGIDMAVREICGLKDENLIKLILDIYDQISLSNKIILKI